MEELQNETTEMHILIIEKCPTQKCTVTYIESNNIQHAAIPYLVNADLLRKFRQQMFVMD